MTHEMLEFIRGLNAQGARSMAEGVTLRVVSCEDFIALKKAFGRSIDLRDIEEL